MSSARSLFSLMAIACAALLGYGYYLQYYGELDPCPLCLMQRFAFMAMLVISLVAALHRPRGYGIRVYAAIGSLISIAGAAIAGRQVWLQHLPPDQVPQCGPGLDYMLDVLPLFEAIRMMLTGSGECAEVDWTFLGLAIAEWSLGWFVLLALGCLYLLLRPMQKRLFAADSSN